MKNLTIFPKKPPLKDLLKHPFPSHPDRLIKIKHHQGVSLRCTANLLEHHASKTTDIDTPITKKGFKNIKCPFKALKIYKGVSFSQLKATDKQHLNLKYKENKNHKGEYIQ